MNRLFSRLLRATAIASLVATTFAATPAFAACSVGQMLELPVTMEGSQAMVAAKINGKPARFVVDSGAFFSSITPGSAAEFGLKLVPAPEDFYISGIGGDVSVDAARVDVFDLGGLAIKKVDFIVGGSETGGAGLLGQNILRVADVEYDLGHGVIRLMKPEGCGRKDNLAYWVTPGAPYSVLDIDPTTVLAPHTMGTVELNGTKLRAMFDTGADRTMLTKAAASRAGVKVDDPGVEESGYVGGIGRKQVQTWIGHFQGLKIGDEEIQKIRLRFGDMTDYDEDILIGADFFLSHRVYVSNSLHRMYFTYNGGPVFDLSTSNSVKGVAGADAAEPATAEAFSRRGAARAARHDRAGALADFTQAIALDPKQASYYRQRAFAYGEGQESKALADLDQAIKLNPADTDALLGRAEIRLSLGKDDDDKPPAGVRADLDAVARIAAPSSNDRLELAHLYAAIDARDVGLPQYDLWIKAHPADSRMPDALNGRCWDRAVLGSDLDQAENDCDKSLRLNKVANVYDSRALVDWKQGDFSKARADYDAALKLDPKLAGSLYGRGLLKLRQGDKAGGEADIAAAKAIDARIVQRAAKWGLKP